MKCSKRKILITACELNNKYESSYECHKKDIERLVSKCKDYDSKKKLLDTVKASAKAHINLGSFPSMVFAMAATVVMAVLTFINLIFVKTENCIMIFVPIIFLIFILILILAATAIYFLIKTQKFQNQTADLELIIGICERLEKESTDGEGVGDNE